jgi:deoxyribose-phosphate aldolase
MNIHELVKNQKTIDLDALKKAIHHAKETAASNILNINTIKKISNLIDLTTLEGKDTVQKVQTFSQKAKSIELEYDGIPNVAAVCIYPSLVKTAKNELQNTSLKVASVAGGFPSGQIPLNLKIAEVNYALEQGADEIDMVISRGTFLAGDYETVFQEIQAIKKVCGTKTLKVILETGELESLENIRLASDIAIYAGADFIKTSTGKIPQGASLEAIWVMLQAIKESGKIIGIKPSGGISTVETALAYYYLVQHELGDKWLTNDLFRFGASSLAGNVLFTLTNDQKALDYFKSSY